MSSEATDVRSNTEVVARRGGNIGGCFIGGKDDSVAGR